ncbi:long-chain fatty acid--CoA ligase [Desulfocarbo indianensis]|nr:long-chain fatty acid--CoA ligase [Desulfocarbo indianensis]
MITGTRIIEQTQSAYSYPLLIKQLLHTPIVYAPDQEIIHRDTKRFTYRELYRRISRLGSGLLKMGAKPGDIVAFLDWDSYRYLEAYFAIPGIGAVLHTVNVRLSPDQVQFTMNHAQDAVVFVHQDFVQLAETIRGQLPSVKKWILIREPGAPEPQTTLTFDAEYEDVLAQGDPDYVFPDFDENSQATLSYTTGTTGDPKGVYFSHRQLVLHTFGMALGVSTMEAQGRFRSNDVYMPLTPMFHVHAWGIPYLATLMGVKQVYPGRYEPEMILKLVASQGVTFSHCVPTILHMLLSSPMASKVDMSKWKVIIGGASLPRGLAKASLDLGIDVYAAYGMSETCPLLTVANLKPDKMDADLDYQLDVRTMTGLPCPMVDLKVMDPEMKPVPADGKTAGEICVRSPWLTQGYFKSPEKSEELWRGGYLHTGDVAVQNAEGYVRITDRLKDVIKTGGEWISSLELESLISRHPEVSEVAVIGVPDEKWGERPLAMVVPKKGRDLNPDSVIQFLNKFVADGTIPKWAVPEKVLLADELPKTSVGKLDKRRIRSVV